MTRRLGLEQWVAIAVSLLVVAVILGAASTGLAHAGSSANGISADSSATATHPEASFAAAADERSRDTADEPSGAVTLAASSVEGASEGPVATTTAPASGSRTTTTTSGATSTKSTSTTTTSTTTTAPATTTTTTTTTSTTTTAPATTTTTTTTTTTAPPPPSIRYYAGNTSDFCARLSGVRTGAGKPALASCTQTSALQSVALQFAQAKSVWHVGTNEIVGYTYKEMSGLVANFKASSTHYTIITTGSTGVTAKVGCYYREDPADLGARYIFCIAQFTY